LAPRRYILRVPGDTVWEAARNYGVTTLPYADFQEAPLPPLVAAAARQRLAYMAKASAIVAPSRHLAGLVRRWLPSAGDVRVIANGVAQDERAGTCTAAPRGDGPLRALFVGRLTNAKGVETILLATRDMQGIAVDIVGDGPELPMLATLHAQLGAPPHVRLLGRKGAAEVKAAMAAAHVLLLPSENEGMSNALLEGCAAGLAPVVSRIPSNLEVIEDGTSALVHDYGDVAALRAALERLATDDALRLRIAAAARRRAADFPFEATVDAYAALIEERSP
ncbi:MAG: glycosyltransferase family 4 protein, partial [Hyphomicrobiaceae bacterium]